MTRLYCLQSAYLFALLVLRTQLSFPYTAPRELRENVFPSRRSASFVVFGYTCLLNASLVLSYEKLGLLLTLTSFLFWLRVLRGHTQEFARSIDMTF
jgi:hypothetical protein